MGAGTSPSTDDSLHWDKLIKQDLCELAGTPIA